MPPALDRRALAPPAVVPRAAPAAVPLRVAHVPLPPPATEPALDLGPRSAGWMPGVEALRGLAAVAVVVFHVWALTSQPQFPGYELVVGLGVWAVDLFFLLSGFLLVQSFWEQPRTSTLGQYYVRRLFRIAPAYYACIAILFLLFAERDLLFSDAGLTQVLANVSFTQWLSPTTASSLNVSGVFWTLSIEMFLYALLPALAWLIARRPVLLGGGLFALGVAYRLYVTLDGEWLQELVFRAAPGQPEGVMRLFLLRQFVGILPLFVVGMLLRWWLHYRPGRSEAARATGSLSAAVLLLLLLPSIAVLFPVKQATDFQYWWLFTGFDVAICLLLVPALAYAGRSVAGSLSFATQALVWLGKRSYGIYLWHFPVILIVLERGPLVRPPDQSNLGLRLLAITVLTVALGALSYKWIERPGRRAGRRLAAALG